jgi:hypothetical protein
MSKHHPLPIQSSTQELLVLIFLVVFASSPFFLPIDDSAIQLFANSILFACFIGVTWYCRVFSRELLKIAALTFSLIIALKLMLP